MIIVVVASSLFLTLAVKPNRLVPTRGQSMAEMSYEFVANMIHSATGEDGLKFFPFVFTLFMFVLCSNFFGMIPGSFTVTSQIAVTLALACLVMLIVIVTGFAKHGIGFFKLFVPHAPWYLLILLVPIEVISFLTRPISLSVRLFANMLAGHTMLAVFARLCRVAGRRRRRCWRRCRSRRMLLIVGDHAAGTAGRVPAGLCLRDPDLHLSQRSPSPPRSSLTLNEGTEQWKLQLQK